MVSFWPWKGEDNSPASFEKALSTLSEKITQSTNRLDSQRKRSRRLKVLWTLYTTFAYILYSIILALVLGWRNWGMLEYSAVVGGPVLIYAVRFGLTSYYDYRITNTENHLTELQKQRETTIEKLKVATKYNSTQELLEKYGASPGKSPSSKSSPKNKTGASPASGKKTQSPQHGGRTGLPPPPTANIRRPSSGPSSSPSTPIRQPQQPNAGLSPLNQGPGPSPLQQALSPSPPPYPQDSSNFAPNAYPAPPQYSEQPRWYDRLMDVLLGEDETLPKNRLALICSNCRLVNGQAPPGVKSAEAIGKWKCGGCGSWNGEETEAKKVIQEIQERSGVVETAPPMGHDQSSGSDEEDDGWKPISRGDEVDAAEQKEGTNSELDEKPVARRTRRSRPLQKVKHKPVEKSEESEEKEDEGEDESEVEASEKQQKQNAPKSKGGRRKH